MKRPITSVIALSLIGAAAFTAQAGATPASDEGGATITFARPSPAESTERVWYIVGRDTLGETDDDGPSPDWDPSVPAEDDDPDFPGNDEWIDEEGYDLPSSIPASDYERMRILQGAGLAGGGTYRQVLAELELAFMFAGREQWVRNIAGGGVADEPRLWDVTMESVMHEPNAERLLLGRTIAVSEERGLQAAHDDLAYWQSLVPEWAPRVRDELAAQGIPFSVELLASPEVNVADPSKPLFAKNAAPDSMFQLGVLQDGENAFLRSLSAEELMLEVWPAYYRYFHRPAGAPVPEDLRAGMTFGSPVLQKDGSYLRSPVMSTDGYRRYAAYGYPGERTNPDNPDPRAYDPTGYGQLWWFRGPMAAFHPDNLSEATLARYEVLLAGG